MGIAFLILDKRTETFRRFLQEGAEVMIQITDFVMRVAPYGIFALVAILVGTIGDKMMSAVLKFILADYIAVGIVLFLIYPPEVRLIASPSPATTETPSTTHRHHHRPRTATH